MFRLAVSVAVEPGSEDDPDAILLSDVTPVCLRAVLGALEVFWCPRWNNWVIATSGALPVVWECALSTVLTQPCTSQGDISNRLLCALLSPALLPTASGLCFLWPGLGGPHTSQGSHRSPCTHASALVVVPAALSSTLDLTCCRCYLHPYLGTGMR